MKSFITTHAMSQNEATTPTLTLSKIVERYAHLFERPEARLRFLHHTLAQQVARQQKLHHVLRRFRFIETTSCYQWLLRLSLHFLIFEELQRQLPTGTEGRRHVLQQIRRSPAASLFYWSYRARHLIYGVCAIVAATALFGLCSLAISSASRLNTYLARQQQQRPPAQGRAAESNGGAESSAVYAATTARYLPGYHPEKVWMVEQKDNYERYSNGARILTEFEIDNHARRYSILPHHATTPPAAVRQEPVGILYHASEGDLLPFTSNNNDSIEERSRRLLEYVRKNRSYNYLIDRFGQIYRIVRDDQAANHAGHSVWADEHGVYVGLNESFIGVSFETSSDVSSLAEQLTEAQLIAGRLLTAILRSHYQIDDADCVTHGLVSVNPANMLIAYHRDWARNFPFEAMGLSDKYQVPPVSITEFGFSSDGTVVWPGVKAAEEEFKRRAEREQVTTEGLRRSLRDRYREQMNLASKLRLTSSGAAEQTGAERQSEGSSSSSSSSDTGNLVER